MTRKEKIKGLYSLKEHLVKNPIELEGHRSLSITLIDYAIEAIKQESCDDCISREHAVYVASGYCHPQNIADELRKLPSVVPQPKTGHWIDGHCSECGCDIPAYISDWKWQKDMDAKYCPNCGTRMVDVSDINDGKMSEGDE